MFKTIKKTQSGFTIIELLVVVSIIDSVPSSAASTPLMRSMSAMSLLLAC